MFSKSSSRLPMIWSASDQPLALTLVRIPFLLKQGTTVEISSERNFRKGRVDWHVAQERNLEKKRLIFVRFLSVSQSGKNRPARDRIPGQNTHTHTSFISLTLKYELRVQDKEINKGCSVLHISSRRYPKSRQEILLHNYHAYTSIKA